MPRRRAGLPVLLLALPAAIALAAGVFGPMVYVGTWVYADTVSYWEFGGVERHALVGAAALALIAVARRSRGLVVAATFGLWGALAFPFVHSRITVHEGGLLTRIGRGLRRPVEEMATQAVLEYDMLHLRWGAWALLGGTLALTLAGSIAMIDHRRPKA